MFLNFLETFFDYILDVLPYFLLASLVGAGLQSLFGSKLLRKDMLNSPLAPIATAVFGATIPVCSCSMIPLARSMDSFSRSYAPVVAFLVTAPVLSPVTLFLTFGMFGFQITAFRFIFSFLFAVLLAYSVVLLFSKSATLPFLQGASGERKGKLSEFLKNFRSLTLSTGRYVLLGLLIASLLKVLVPQDLVLKFSGSFLSYPLTSLVSVPIYVCSGEEVPIAKSMYELGLKPGQSLTFMLASSGICIPTITALLSFLPKRLVLLYSVSWFLFATVAGLITDYLLS